MSKVNETIFLVQHVWDMHAQHVKLIICEILARVIMATMRQVKMMNIYMLKIVHIKMSI